MSLSSDRDKQIAKSEESASLRKQRNSTPPDNHGDQYVTGTEKLYTQGKGAYRVIKGWYSKAMTEKFNRIFNRMADDKDQAQADTDCEKYHAEVDHKAMEKAIEKDGKKKAK